MLNRQTVRNVTIPLIPGEMKLTVVDTSTLQVARRGESWSCSVVLKVKRSLYTSSEEKGDMV
jgi:hypothetical protein